MKKYEVLSAVTDSQDNHKYYKPGSTIKLNKERAEPLVERGIIRELTEEEEAEEADKSAQKSKEDKGDSITKEEKEVGITKADTPAGKKKTGQ